MRRGLTFSCALALIGGLSGCGSNAKPKIGLSCSDFIPERWPRERDEMTKILEDAGRLVLLGGSPTDTNAHLFRKGPISGRDATEAGCHSIARGAAYGVRIVPSLAEDSKTLRPPGEVLPGTAEALVETCADGRKGLGRLIDPGANEGAFP